ncbi:hypothetical protein [Acerihabitans arboris]|uniref:Uncharacterized protein n=1 Tax=Acerihabitans arboris TaxID=2691583 RepID=A0A845SLD0_9GAMM|nr:hypothetical protein [Acerihabitans arboris]NDL63378.1 hypothetical protein [Acerihabitans arboris]
MDVDTLPAFLQAIGRRQACRWRYRPDIILACAFPARPVLTLRIDGYAHLWDLLRQMLTDRYQEPARYDGFYVGVEAPATLAVFYRPQEEATDIDYREGIMRMLALARLD